MANVVVIGAGLAGLPTAYELRHWLPKRHTVTLISNESKFTFIPGLIQVALNLKSLDHIQLDLSRLAQRHQLNWVHGRVTNLTPDRKQLVIEESLVIEYDYLAIATGAALAFDQISGSGPNGYTQSVCTPHHALAARQAWLDFLKNPGPLVVGAAPGVGCFGPAYEFVLMAEHELRRLGLRQQVPITYITPEPYVGHLGVSNIQHSQKLTTALMQEREIKVIENAEITAVNQQTITLADGRTLPFAYSMILPTFRGVDFVRAVPGLADDQGFIPVLPNQRHPQFSTIYAAGVSTQLEQPDQTPIPITSPKSGQMAETMAAAVAHNIAVELGAMRAPLQVPTLDALCFAEFGQTGIAYIAAPVLPDPETGKRKRSYAVRGPWVVWVKTAFEHYFMLKMRSGLGMPWFEKLGLRALFGLKMLKADTSSVVGSRATGVDG
ncbi:sulfide-quinone reductase [Leptolyngbya sp. Heron Island J]|uniref:NAD(P)/FAD-dependent oxidoreductase n=1 Tax=Leptolyngbya sp. Heron Island J TaxID=1385935 RepID=UPI0003B94FA8|nr:FAD-dependent oxidoreductase [Leptolyngbya sp. Heron Island J]ESA34197.1 sulfide-quinone reductase [Leptolyngbya sp. Heron Island J]